MCGLGVEDVPTLHAARQRGLIPQSVTELAIHGDLSRFVIPDFKLTPKHDVQLWGSKNKIIAKILATMFANRPIIDQKECIGCAECQKVCPAQENYHSEKNGKNSKR